MLERAFCTLFWLRYCNAGSRLPTKVIEFGFTDDITGGWRCDTPTHPLAMPLVATVCYKVTAFQIEGELHWVFANMSIIMLVECAWTFHVVERSGQIGQHCSPTNSIRHKLNAVYVVLAAV